MTPNLTFLLCCHGATVSSTEASNFTLLPICARVEPPTKIMRNKNNVLLGNGVAT